MVEQIEITLAIGGLTPVQRGTLEASKNHLERQAKRIEELEAAVERQESELIAIRKGQTVTLPRAGGGFEQYDLSPVMKESALRDKLIDLGWRTPEQSAELRAENAELRERIERECVWVPHIWEGWRESDCGLTAIASEVEEWTCCPYCGGKIVEKSDE